jgi:hypothetical protein
MAILLKNRTSGNLCASNGTVLYPNKKYEIEMSYEILAAKHPELIKFEQQGKLFISEDVEIVEVRSWIKANPFAIVKYTGVN